MVAKAKRVIAIGGQKRSKPKRQQVATLEKKAPETAVSRLVQAQQASRSTDVETATILVAQAGTLAARTGGSNDEVLQTAMHQRPPLPGTSR